MPGDKAVIVPKDGNRSWPRDVWKYFYRLGRCMERAALESGNVENMLCDLIVYGTGFITPEQQECEATRIAELMHGLKK